MSVMPETNYNYNDFTGLSRLRANAKNDSEAALQEVAKKFESVFVQMMIKSMREASVPLQGELFNGNQSKAYTDMYDKQLGLELSRSNGIGLADVIVRQLSRTVTENSSDSVDPLQTFNATSSINDVNDVPTVSAFVPVNEVDSTEEAMTSDFVQVRRLNSSTDLQVEAIEASSSWQSPEDFIRDSWPHAQRAGRELGVDPRVILAQSALETGWGNKVYVTEQGENSYSLFGIKANSGWQGRAVSFNTLEFRSGSMNRERASFRAYDSIAESYSDYVNFLQSNPRYQNVLEAGSATEYSQQLQRAGYATDPNYSDKIERIRTGELINKVVSELELTTTEPLT